MKKILSAIGLLAVAAPTTLSVIACASVEEESKNYGLNNDVINAISEVINDWVDNDVTNRVNGNFTYDQFYGEGRFIQLNLLDLLAVKISEILNENKEKKYNGKELNMFIALARVWALDSLHLVYVNVPIDKEEATRDDQEIVTEITRDYAGDRSLETIYLDEVNIQLKQQGKDKIDNIEEVLNIFPYARFGVRVDKKIGNVSLNLIGRDFWTATFVSQNIN